MRPSSPGAEKHLHKYYPALDHGFVSLVDYMGNDQEVERSARVSYGKGTRAVNKTRDLIRYLYRHRHTTPFEMVEVKFHVAMPIFVARQWVRHRTANINEYSGRYSLMPHTVYQPDKLRLQSASNAQGSAEATLCCGKNAEGLQRLLDASNAAFDAYEWLDGEGVARELSRIGLPLSTYTQWYWKIDLHNLMHFLKLRCDSHAQPEIQVFADLIAGIINEAFPLAVEAWRDYALDGATVSYAERLLLSTLIHHRGKLGDFSDEDLRGFGLNGREVEEFKAKFESNLDTEPRKQFLLPHHLTPEQAFVRFFPGTEFNEDS